jgi:hypothetical protein
MYLRNLHASPNTISDQVKEDETDGRRKWEDKY